MRFSQDMGIRHAAMRWLIGIAVAVITLPTLGCLRDDDITQETVTQQDRQQLRLRVAMIEHNDIAWFIRIEGPVALMKQHEAAFESFVKSSRFSDRKETEMTWTVPAGWKEDPPSMGRFATYRIPAKPKELEIKITQMSGKNFDFMSNMHRWQQAVNVPLSEKFDDAMKYVRMDKTERGISVKFIDMTGLGVHKVSTPAAPGAAKDRDMLGFEDDPGKLPFRYKVPDGWSKKAKLPQFSVDAYEAPGVGKSVDITISPASGRLSDNVIRWRQQVGLGPASPKEVADSVADVKVADRWGYYADINVPDGKPDRPRILAVIVPLEHSRWFIVMRGQHDSVGKNKQDFEAFLKSFKRL